MRLIDAPPVDLACFDLPDAAVIAPGEDVLVRTWSAAEYPFLTGPLRVDGVRPGDTLAFHLDDLELDRFGRYGFASTTKAWEPWGGVLRESAASEYAGHAEIVGTEAILDGRHRIEVRPMLGWIGLVRQSLIADPWDHGGNLDTSELRPGSTLYLYDDLGLGRFVIGDAHAAMGDGEVSGQGIEIGARCRLRVEIHRGTEPHRPLVETQETLVQLCSRFTEKDAYTQAISDAVHHVAFSQQVSFEEANALVSLIGELRVSSVVSHSPTFKMLVARRHLAPIADLLHVAKPALPHTPR
ncbi:acetamidase/formamidase family protein [Kribbella sp. NPDC054772]